MLETPTRPRGAQPGNQNARTHGFYTCNLDELQESTIEQAKRASGIDDEIAIVRAKLRNVLEKDPDNARLTAQMATTIGHLLRVRLKLGEAVLQRDPCDAGTHHSKLTTAVVIPASEPGSRGVGGY